MRAAAAEMYLPDAPGISRWMWADRQGQPMGREQRLSFLIALTPQLIATAAGYEAAWHEDVWERMQSDAPGVAAEIAAAVRSERSFPDCLYFAAGISGRPPDSSPWWDEAAGGYRFPDVALQGAAWWDDGWAQFNFPARETVHVSEIPDEPRSGPADYRWAARCLITQARELGRLGGADELVLTFGQLVYRPLPPHNPSFTAAIGPQGPLGATRIRIFLGTAEQWAMVPATLD
jgi:hypothetical protein